MIRAALIENPNVGKTEIFNSLTGLSQKKGIVMVRLICQELEIKPLL